MLKDEVLHALALFKKENGVSDCRLGVAGSVARGEETQYSDIDVVVDKNCISIDEIEKSNTSCQPGSIGIRMFYV